MVSKKKVPVKIVKTRESAAVPFYATASSAGFDLIAAEDVLIEPQGKRKVNTGLRFEIPTGYEMQIRDRSGVVWSTDLTVENSPGTIDADYRGEVSIILRNNSPMTTHLTDMMVLVDGNIAKTPEGVLVPVGSILVRAGDRVAQGVIAAVPQAEFTITTELSDTERGDGGFGHTGVATKTSGAEDAEEDL
jgi:dUTP pyrophosphatase